MYNSALVNSKKKIPKRSQKIPKKSKKVGRKKPRKHYKESEESSKQQPNQGRSRTDWRGAVDRFRNASPEEQRKMRGEFVRRMRSRGRNMKRRTNSRRRQEEFGRDEHKSDFQHREREMEMEKLEHEHHFQLERMQREHEIEYGTPRTRSQNRNARTRFPLINFEPELPYDEMSDEQREKIQLVWFQLQQKKIQKRLMFGSMRLR